MKNCIEFEVYGKYALFTDPITKLNGEKFTYDIPTYEALKGIARSIYWKPTFIWVIDEVRIMNRIRTHSKGMTPSMKKNRTLSIYTYLCDVKYQIKAHFEWNLNMKNFKNDRNEKKHFEMAKRSLKAGGRRDVFLGTRDCQADVRKCEFGDGVGFYDNTGEIEFDNLFHGFDYPNEIGVNEYRARYWKPVMKDGVIKFIRPNKCKIVDVIKKMKPVIFDNTIEV